MSSKDKDGDPPFDTTKPMPAGDQVPQRRRVALLVYHHDAVESIPLRPGESVTIGRGAPAERIISDGSLSRLHARFTLVEGEVAVEDLGSTNGTWIAGRLIERSTVKQGDEVMMGAVSVTVNMLAGGEVPTFGFEGHDLFYRNVDAEIHRAGFCGRTLAVMMVRPFDPQSHPLHLWWPNVQRLLRSIDHSALYAPETVELLFPELGAEQARDVARAIVTPGAGPSLLACGLALFRSSGSSAEALLAATHDAARKATLEQPLQIAPQVEPLVVHLAGAATGDQDEGPVAESLSMRFVLQQAERLAGAVIPVLIQGETGTGKEEIARFLHEHGPRRNKPMVCINCGALPGELIESILFGHERGAFTHALQTKKGAFEDAAGGTLFFDEIGELPLLAQVKLLRALETKKIQRVGANREIDVDVRVIAATNRDLEAMCITGRFRSDLFYRLHGAALVIPPLRARREDIEPLVMRFLRKANKENGRAVTNVESEVFDLLMAYNWPGNARELRNYVERAVVFAEDGTIRVDHLPEQIRAAGIVAAPPPALASSDGLAHPGGEGLNAKLARYEVELIREALRKTYGNQTEAAKLLEVPLRTLQRKIAMFGIKRPY